MRDAPLSSCVPSPFIVPAPSFAIGFHVAGAWLEANKMTLVERKKIRNKFKKLQSSPAVRPCPLFTVGFSHFGWGRSSCRWNKFWAGSHSYNAWLTCQRGEVVREVSSLLYQYLNLKTMNIYLVDKKGQKNIPLPSSPCPVPRSLFVSALALWALSCRYMVLRW